MKNLLFIFIFCLHASTHAGVQIIDDRGVQVSFSQSPQRIVSLLPSLTESVCELGRCQRLVGVDRYSNYPASVRALPQLGGGLDPNIEAVLALRPDVVLLASSSRAIEQLQGLGLKVLALEPKTLLDVQRVLEKLGQLLEVKDAHLVWRRIDAGVTQAAKTLAPQARAQRVYFEASEGAFAASESSFIGEILTRLDVGNIVPGSLGPFPKLSGEFVVRANPDIIMLGENSQASLAQRPGWSALRAVREQRICAFTHEQADVLVRAGPRMAEAAHMMVRCLNWKTR